MGWIGWNIPKYSLNIWLSHKVHQWATILRFLLFDFLQYCTDYMFRLKAHKFFRFFFFNTSSFYWGNIILACLFSQISLAAKSQNSLFQSITCFGIQPWSPALNIDVFEEADMWHLLIINCLLMHIWRQGRVVKYHGCDRYDKLQDQWNRPVIFIFNVATDVYAILLNFLQKKTTT